MSASKVLRAIGDDMALVFGRHPDHARVHFIRDDAPTAELAECESCGELFQDTGEPDCEECVLEGQAGYRSEHDNGAER
jgi:hypothetical protein